MNKLIKIAKQIAKGSLWATLLVGGLLTLWLIGTFVFTYSKILYFIIPFLVLSYILGAYQDYCCKIENKDDKKDLFS